LEDRVEIVSALGGVDYCVVFRNRTVDRLLDFLRPDVHAKGPDHREASVPDGESAIRYGGQVHNIGPREGRGTTDLLERIKAMHERCKKGR